MKNITELTLDISHDIIFKRPCWKNITKGCNELVTRNWNITEPYDPHDLEDSHNGDNAIRKAYKDCMLQNDHCTADLQKNSEDFTNLCIYEPDECGKITINTNGRHLLDCKTFKCTSNYFKCPMYYCIPWKMVCNTVWDCPMGTDEKLCAERHSCKGNFKCHESKICLTVPSLCDGINDCHHKDDEIFCHPGIVPCPTSCSCLLFTISCTYIILNARTLIVSHSNSHVMVKMIAQLEMMSTTVQIEVAVVYLNVISIFCMDLYVYELCCAGLPMF